RPRPARPGPPPATEAGLFSFGPSGNGHGTVSRQSGLECFLPEQGGSGARAGPFPIQESSTVTPWSIASAQKLAAACPRLLELPELPGTDPLQAWSTWNRLVALGPRPQVLEVGQGPWTTVLAIMACTLGGGLRTLGTDPTDAERLRADFARLGIADRCHVDTVDLADAEVGDRRTRFPDLAGLPPDAAFELVWVATPRAVPEQDCLDHVLPVVSSHLSPRGFDVVLEAPERPAAEQAAAFWDRLTDSAFTIATDALHGTGMLVSGRPDGAAADRSRPGPV